MYCFMEDKLSSKHRELLQIISGVVCLKLWKTRCAIVIQQIVIGQISAPPI